MKEFADNVSGGSDAEKDGADDLLPPGQQQHGILPPATASSRFVPLYQANRRVMLLSVDVAVGEVVAVVWKERANQRRSDGSSPGKPPFFTVSYRMDTGGRTELHCCIHRERTCHC